MNNVHGTNDSTAMKFCPTTTSCSVRDKRAVTDINFVSIDVELISWNLFIIVVIDLEET